MKPIVIYYSRKGSNKFLAEKISEDLSCPIEAIQPRINALLPILMSLQPGIKRLKNKIEEYDTVILCGPVFVGKFIAPLRQFVKKYYHKINRIVFVTCCGSSDDKKFDKFGHGLVFKNVEDLLKEKCLFCEAFPIDLVLTPEVKNDSNAQMNTHLTDANFKGAIKERYDTFIDKIKAM